MIGRGMIENEEEVSAEERLTGKIRDQKKS